MCSRIASLTLTAIETTSSRSLQDILESHVLDRTIKSLSDLGSETDVHKLGASIAKHVEILKQLSARRPEDLEDRDAVQISMAGPSLSARIKSEHIEGGPLLKRKRGMDQIERI